MNFGIPTARAVGLAAGPLAAVLCYALLPETYAGAGGEVAFTHAGRATLAMMVWMATWWLTEALPLAPFRCWASLRVYRKFKPPFLPGSDGITMPRGGRSHGVG
jgi:hypothetical protein